MSEINDARDVLRRFNRSYTQRIGVLDDSFLGSGRPLGLARLLFEIGPSGATVLDLRARLGLDSGYVSRLLRDLEHDSLVTVTPDPDDGRRRVVRLTSSGEDAWDDLDGRSDDLAARLVAPLSARQQRELTDALTTADRLLRAATITFDSVDPHHPEARQAMEHYFAELDARFPSGFDHGDALDEGAVTMRGPTGDFIVAHDGETPVSCGGIQRIDDQTGEVKRMWVAPPWRGTGLGWRTLAHLEDRVRSLGYRRVVLDTNATLTEAISMYERAGYQAIECYNDNPYADRWFAKDLDAVG